MRCRFKHKIFQNEENGYTIAIFTTQDTSVPLSARDKYLASRNIIGFSAIGFGLPLTDEIELEMEGRWESGEHGTQYQVENFMEVVPRTKEGILGYLSSGAIKGIGPKMADTIFRKFGLQTLEIMENNPQELLKIRGISEKKLAAIVESYGKNQVFRELMTFLAPFKVTPKKVNMILKKFGNESVDIIRHRPYMLSAVKGFGFLTVDAIGRQCCCALNDPMRISGCIGHIMNQAMKERGTESVKKILSIQCVGEKLEYAVYEILSSHILHNYIEREVSAGLRIEWSSLSFFRKNEGSVTFCCRSPPSSEFFGT